jgi:hypothetical protein
VPTGSTHVHALCCPRAHAQVRACARYSRGRGCRAERAAALGGSHDTCPIFVRRATGCDAPMHAAAPRGSTQLGTRVAGTCGEHVAQLAGDTWHSWRATRGGPRRRLPPELGYHVRIWMRRYLRAHARTHTQANARTHTRKHTHNRTHTRARARARVRAHAQTHTRTRART